MAPAANAVRADGETMRLVPQPLDEVKDRIARLELEWIAPRYEESFHPGVPIRALGDGNERHVDDAERREGLLCRAQLAAAAVDNDEIGPRRVSIAIRATGDVDRLARLRSRAGRTRHRARRLVHQPLETAAQHLPHHAEVVARHQVGGTDIEFAVLVFLEPLRPGDDHGADGVAALDVAVVVDLDAARRARQGEAL